MANSFVRYTGNGSTTAYSISYSYRDAADLIVTINGAATTSYTLNGAGSTLTFDTAPANASAIEIRRKTSQTSRLTDYAAGSVLTENDLDTDSEQAFFMSQEAIDDANDVISLDNADFQWDVQSKRLKNVANPTADTDAVNKQFISTNIPNITTVSGISADVTTVAGISANVTTVANDATDIGLVATNIADVTTVATNINDVIKVADDLNEAISEIETAANDLNETTSEIDTVSTNIANVNIVGGINADVTTVANNETDIQTLADLEDGTVTTNGLSTLAGLNTEIQGVYNIRTNVTNVDTNSANVNLVAGQISPTNNVSTVSAVATEIGTLGALGTEITNLNNIRTDITGVNTISADVTAVNNNSANINTVAGLDTEITALGASGTVASINTVATNINSVNSFANTYLGASATAPTQDPDGSSLDLGDLYFDTVSDTMKVYSSGGWINAGSAVNGTANRFKYTASASQTTFTGSDDNSNTLAYDAGFIDVYLNGIRLVNGSDFTATSGTSIVLTTGASANDILEIVAFGTFSLSNFSITDANDVPASLGTAGQALVVNASANALEFSNASSAEVYGFNKYYNPSTLVKTVTAVGGVYVIDGVSQDTLDLYEGNTYIFNHPSSHPFRFSTDSNNTSAYTTGVTVNSSTQVTIVVASNAPTLYYYCSSHSGMGGTANTPIPANNAVQYITTNQGQDNITESQYANFDDVLFSASGFVFSINSNGNLISTI